MFYGALNDRRRSVLLTLQEKGLNVQAVFTYGAERDEMISRAKVILNVHYYIPAVLEVARLGYLWANRKAVVSELNESTELAPGLEACCIYAPYENLVNALLYLLKNKARREELEQRAFDDFSRLKQEDFLRPVVGGKNKSI